GRPAVGGVLAAQPAVLEVPAGQAVLGQLRRDVGVGVDMQLLFGHRRPSGRTDLLGSCRLPFRLVGAQAYSITLAGKMVTQARSGGDGTAPLLRACEVLSPAGCYNE